jgi:two-component system, OmpR family, phosphate regulon sensor histidine kinase PhoR
VIPDRSPRAVALVSSAVITGVFALVFFFSIYLLDKSFEWQWLAVFLAIGFGITYFLVAFFIERFLYRKVKIIYKTIHSLKTQNENQPRIRMGSDVLEEVNNKVAEWAEEKIKEVKELIATDNFRKEFIGNLAHELKTPVFNIQGYIDTLLDGELEDPALTRKFLEKAGSNCDRLSDLLKDLDQISTFESGNVPLNISRFDVVDLAKKTIDSLDQQAREKNIRLYIKNANEKPIYVLADRSRIEQVFVNLLVNSVAYGKQDGETRVRFYDMEDNILIEVADDGLGMSKEHLPRIFERFYRVDKSRSRNEGGSGLGLAICKHIIESHRQTISVRSTEGIGSTFSFTLKAEQQRPSKRG